jgi:hypothetical protein
MTFKRHIVDASTGAVEIVDLTEAEVRDFHAAGAQAAAQHAEEQRRRTERQDAVRRLQERAEAGGPLDARDLVDVLRLVGVHPDG